MPVLQIRIWHRDPNSFPNRFHSPGADENAKIKKTYLATNVLLKHHKTSGWNPSLLKPPFLSGVVFLNGRVATLKHPTWNMKLTGSSFLFLGPLAFCSVCTYTIARVAKNLSHLDYYGRKISKWTQRQIRNFMIQVWGKRLGKLSNLKMITLQSCVFFCPI